MSVIQRKALISIKENYRRNDIINIMNKVEKVIASLVQLLALSSGRDKLCRVVQYFCKFLTTKYSQLEKLHPWQRSVVITKRAKSESLMNAMSMTRKVLRFGPSINCCLIVMRNIQAIKNGQQNQELLILVLKTMSAFFLGIFFICDHYLWLLNVGVIADPKYRQRMQFFSALGWLLDCFTSLIKNAVTFLGMNEKQKQAGLKALIIDTARVALDVPIAFYFTVPDSVNGKLVGQLGTITSLIGIYQLWK